MLFELLGFLISLIALSKISDFTVENLLEIAKLTKIEQWALGFLLLSMVTCLPELSISMISVIKQAEGIPIGVSLGSVVTDLGLGLGLGGILYGIKISFKSLRKMIDILFLSSIIILLIALFPIGNRISGLFLVSVFIFFSLYSRREKLKLEKLIYRPKTEFEKLLLPFKLYKHIFLFLFSGILVVIFSYSTVHYGAELAKIIKIPNAIIAATLVSLGTSLPEISTSLSALKKKKPTIAVSNLVGSSFIQLTLVLGIPSFFTNVFIENSGFLVAPALFTVLLTWFFLGEKERGKIDFREALTLLVAYLMFLALITWRLR